MAGAQLLEPSLLLSRPASAGSCSQELKAGTKLGAQKGHIGVLIGQSASRPGKWHLTAKPDAHLYFEFYYFLRFAYLSERVTEGEEREGRDLGLEVEKHLISTF